MNGSVKPPSVWWDTLPPLLTAAAFWVTGLKRVDLFMLTPGLLAKIMQVEFMVIGAGAFVFTLELARRQEKSYRRKYVFLEWGCVLFFGLFSLVYGWEGPFLYLAALGATFWGAWREPEGSGLPYVLLVRWFVILVLFIVSIQVLDLPREVMTWRDSPDLHVAGIVYFFSIAVLNWAGFFREPWWEKLWNKDPRNDRGGE